MDYLGLKGMQDSGILVCVSRFWAIILHTSTGPATSAARTSVLLGLEWLAKLAAGYTSPREAFASLEAALPN